MKKKCYKCQKEKDLQHFSIRKRNKDGRQEICKECNRIICKKYYNKDKTKRLKASKEDYKINPIKYKQKNLKSYHKLKHTMKYKVTKRRNTLKKYQLTMEEYDEIFQRQNGKCAICYKSETIMRNGKIKLLCIDHDHNTNRVRGLLCHRCNVSIGAFEDNITLLQNAINYLQQ